MTETAQDILGLCHWLSGDDTPPPYLLWRLELPAGRGAGGDFEGAASAIGWAVWVDVLRRQGCWRGPAPTILLNDDLRSAPPEVLAGVIVHEYGHVLTWPTPWEPVFLDGNFFLACDRQVENATEPQPVEILRMHGPGFIRAALHLSWRLQRHGLDVGYVHTCDTLSYGLSSVGNYVRALGGELERFSSWPIKTILAIELPRAFKRLWQEDVHFFLKRQGADNAANCIPGGENSHPQLSTSDNRQAVEAGSAATS